MMPRYPMTPVDLYFWCCAAGIVGMRFLPICLAMGFAL